MAPPRTGTIEPHGDHFDARVRVPGGKKGRRICLDSSLTREAAKLEAGELQRIVDEEHAKARAVSSATPRTARSPSTRAGIETCDQWAERWFADREGLRGLSSVGDDRGRWKKW